MMFGSNDLKEQRVALPRTSIAVVFGALVLVACSEEPPPAPVADELISTEAEGVAYEFYQVLTREGVRYANVTADTAYSWQDSNTVSLRNLRLITFQDDGRERATITAESGTLDPRTERMVARGNVVLLLREEGRRIETEELFLDQESNRIWSEVASTFYEDENVTYGDSFEADLDFSNFRIQGARGTRVEIDPEGGGGGR